MTYRFLSGAQRDLADAMEYYEQAIPGLGFEFLEDTMLISSVFHLHRHPDHWKDRS